MNKDNTLPKEGELDTPTQKTRFDITDKNGSGRPPKIDDNQKARLLEEYIQYIRETSDPTIADFVTSNELCWDWNILDHDIEKWPEFSDYKRRAQIKQEAYLLKSAGKNEYNPTLAIFRLKQPIHAYTDRSEVKTEGEVTHKYEDMDDDQLEAIIKSRKDTVS